MKKLINSLLIFIIIIGLGSCSEPNKHVDVDNITHDHIDLKCDRTLLQGRIIKKPGIDLFKFQEGRFVTKDGDYLSHMIFYILTSNNQVYQISIDNLYYDHMTESKAKLNFDDGITADYVKRFKINDEVVACGDTYINRKNERGIHWLHPSTCDNEKNGFLKINHQDITYNTKLCDNCVCKYGKKRISRNIS